MERDAGIVQRRWCHEPDVADIKPCPPVGRRGFCCNAVCGLGGGNGVARIARLGFRRLAQEFGLLLTDTYPIISTPQNPICPIIKFAWSRFATHKI